MNAVMVGHSGFLAIVGLVVYAAVIGSKRIPPVAVKWIGAVLIAVAAAGVIYAAAPGPDPQQPIQYDCYWWEWYCW